MKPLVAPVVNMNGNTKNNLLEQVKEIHHKIAPLIKAIYNGSDLWHGRNYQTIGQEHRHDAEDAWRERIRWLDEFERELEEMYLKLDLA